MIGPREKRVKKVRLASASQGDGGLDLARLPGFVSYRAAMLREKVLVQHALAALGIVFMVHFAVSRFEVLALQRQLREKEYILAPGVQDFTPASPQRVSDGYVQAAVLEFLSTLGNVNPSNIDEQYGRLAQSMAPGLRVRFQAEAADWISRVRRDNLSEILTVTKREVVADDLGGYRVRAFARCESFAGSESLGVRSEVVEMDLALVPPRPEARWFLEITRLARMSEKSYETRKTLQEGGKHE